MGLSRALAGTVAVHVALMFGLWLLPDRSRPAPTAVFEGVEVVLLDRFPASRARVEALPRELPPEPEPAASSGDVEPMPAPGPLPGRRESRRPAAAPSDDSEPDPVVTPREPATLGGTKVALGSLRDLRGDDAGVVFAPDYNGGPDDRASRSEGVRVSPNSPKDAGEIHTPGDAGFVRRKDGRLVFRPPGKHMRWSAELFPDGRVRFTDHMAPYRDPDKGRPPPSKSTLAETLGSKVKGLQFKFATPKELGSKGKGIQFWLKAKRRLLSATAPMRFKMAEDFAEANIERELAQLGANLVRIWNSNKPPRTRRGLLFELWDECEEPSAEPGRPAKSTVDAVRRDAGMRARRRIVGFIRRNLPNGAENGFRAAELVALNERRISRGRFDPYAGGPGVPAAGGL